MIHVLKKESSVQRRAKKLPDSPGVYFFFGPRKKILYIGKATSLHDRVKSYFAKDIIESRGPLIHEMIGRAHDVGFTKTDSVLEALILEAHLIKKHQPPFNTKEKSDKSFNYVVVTDEDFPRVLIVRGKEVSKRKTIRLKSKILNLKSIFGPFPQGSVLKEALKIVRKIFPFRDYCAPPHRKHTDKLEYVGMSFRRGMGGKLFRKPCFNEQIALCPGVCTGEISRKEYQKTIRNITMLFGGKKKNLLRTLAAEMRSAARKKEFEKAGELKRKMFALKHIQDISLIKYSGSNESLFSNSQEFENRFGGSGSGLSDGNIRRIEAYDVAHTAGKHTVGVMVVVEDGERRANDYRKFNIKAARAGDDVGALREMFERRLAHSEWALPRLFVVDGGRAQVSAVKRILETYEMRIPVVGVVKDERHRPKNILGDGRIIRRFEKDVLLANSEAHRFALAFHAKRRSASLRHSNILKNVGMS